MEEEIYIKDFKNWQLLKERLEANTYFPVVMKGDIWNLYVGINLGNEIDGKGEKFIRPVYALKRLSKHAFIGIPLSRKGDSPYRVEISNTGSFLVFSQIKSFSIKRCVEFIRSLTLEEQNKIDDDFYKFLKQENPL